MLRNPVDRLLSDYNFFKRGYKSSYDFHDKCVRAIAWWHDCVTLYPMKRCLYGLTPPGLPLLDMDVCIVNHGGLGCTHAADWRNNSAGRLRIGLYGLYLQDWFSVFVPSHILVLKYEEFILNGSAIIQNVVYPFLDVPRLGLDRLTTMKRILSKKQRTSSSRNKSHMLPQTRKLLEDFYQPFNEKLAKTLGSKKWLFK